jgi:hypothetical protein
MEKYFYKTIHEARISAGQMHSWVLFSRVVPAGTDADFDFVTFNGYAENGGKWDEEIVRTALTEEERRKMPKARDIRALASEEIWTPIIHSMPSRKSARP